MAISAKAGKLEGMLFPAARLRYPVAQSKRACATILVALAPCLCAWAQPAITLEEAAARNPPEFTPLYEGRSVLVTGQVSSNPVRFADFLHLAIQEGGHGLVLEGTEAPSTISLPATGWKRVVESRNGAACRWWCFPGSRPFRAERLPRL